MLDYENRPDFSGNGAQGVARSKDETTAGEAGQKAAVDDQTYANSYFERSTSSSNSEDRSKEITRLKGSMLIAIKAAAEQTSATLSFNIATSDRKLTDESKQKLSAYRTVAQENGYVIGEFKIDHATHLATAEVKVNTKKKDADEKARLENMRKIGQYLSVQKNIAEKLEKSGKERKRPGE